MFLPLLNLGSLRRYKSMGVLEVVGLSTKRWKNDRRTTCVLYGMPYKGTWYKSLDDISYEGYREI